VHGSWVLDRVTRTDELDFFFVFSSVVTLLGGGGGGAYTAANSYLDAFAAHRNRKGRTTHAVNWPIWENTGATKAYTVNRERDLFHVLKPETAVAAFGTLLGQKEERTVVGQFNDDGIIMELANYLPFRFAPELHVKQAWSGRANAESSRKRQGVRLTGNGRNEYTATETRVAEIWHEVLGEEELDVHQSFFDIGGDSILLARLQTLIEDAYPNTVSISDLFAFPSIGKLSQYIDSQMLSVEPADLAAQKDEKQGMRENEDKGIERTIDELLADIETGRLTVDKAVQSYRAAGDK
jgi:acyl carrier protein